ncbi:MAG TPA: hypothetical protein VML55_09220 [Planctomycetaceae bacterium]|nr:hypothetical protein [Planctomycetaceae bacterium]
MPKDQILIGSLFAVVCLIVAWKARWMCEHSNVGRRLAERLGVGGAMWVIRAVFGALAVFGVLLATNVVRPVQW